MIDIEEIMAGMSPRTRQRVHAASEVIIEKLPTPSIALNKDLNGGLGYGRQTLLWGNKSSGKSAFCLQMVGGAQRQGKTCAWVDAEKSFDPDWASRLGVNSKQLILSEVQGIADMAEVGVELMTSGVDVVVVDSISALLSSAYFDKSEDLKNLDDTKQIGSDARDMANCVRMLNYANNGSALVLISQIRNKIGTWGASPQPTGGEAVKFFSSTVLKLTSSPRDDNQIKGDLQVNGRVRNAAVGRPVNWLVEYNKLGPSNLTGSYDFYYKGPEVGVDAVAELFDVADECGIIEKAGSWYTVGGQRVQGRTKGINLLRENPGLQEEIIKALNE